MTPLLALQSHYLTGHLRLKSVKLGFKTKFSALKKLETSLHLSWKALLTEAKTQFGIQKCKVRVCRIMKVANRKIRVNLMHVNLV